MQHIGTCSTVQDLPNHVCYMLLSSPWHSSTPSQGKMLSVVQSQCWNSSTKWENTCHNYRCVCEVSTNWTNWKLLRFTKAVLTDKNQIPWYSQFTYKVIPRYFYSYLDTTGILPTPIIKRSRKEKNCFDWESNTEPQSCKPRTLPLYLNTLYDVGELINHL